MKSIQFNPLVS